MAAVLFLGERFTLVNALGLLILICGVGLFNFIKYRKLRAGELPSAAAAPGGREHEPPSRRPPPLHMLVSLLSSPKAPSPPEGLLGASAPWTAPAASVQSWR